MAVTEIASGDGGATTEESTVANISRITDRIWTGGDLSSLGDEAMLADLAEIQSAGISHIIDNRIEWSDQAFVEAHAPKNELLLVRAGRRRSGDAGRVVR